MSNIKFPLLQDPVWVKQAAATMTRDKIANAVAVGGRKPGPRAIADAIKRAKAQGVGTKRYRETRMDRCKRNRNKRIAALAREGWSDASIGAEFHLTNGAARKIRRSLKVEKKNRSAKGAH